MGGSEQNGGARVWWGRALLGLGCSVVMLEESAESFGTLDRTRTQRGLAFDQRVAETLVISLEVIVSHVLADRAAKRSFPKEDQSVEALGLDRQDESLCEGVEIRRFSREFEASNSGVSENGPEFVCELRIPIMKQEIKQGRFSMAALER